MCIVNACFITLSLTLHPVAKGVPGFTEILADAVIHNTHMSKTTVGVRVGGRVCHSGLVQPSSSAQVQTTLHTTHSRFTSGNVSSGLFRLHFIETGKRARGRGNDIEWT